MVRMDCEDNCCRYPDGFKIRDAMLAHAPYAAHEGMTVYEGARIPEIDCEKLIFFAMSVYWRAGA